MNVIVTLVKMMRIILILMMTLVLVGCEKTPELYPLQPLWANMVCVDGIAHAWYDKGKIEPKLRPDGTPCVCIKVNKRMMFK